ncbi:hypothetical protein JXO52_08950 [bacterium]|nr:hypothetical protein [bacterium]
MAKVQSFADKMAKGTLDFTKHCSTCEESYTMIKLVTTDKSPETNSYKFKERIVAMCKCNENELIA